MRLLEAIHERWRTEPRLTTLVPAHHVVTGIVPSTDAAGNRIVLPFVTIELDPEFAASRTSSGVWYLGEVAFNVATRTLDEARSIADAVASRYDRQRFDATFGTMIDMMYVRQSRDDSEQGVWLVHLVYHALWGETR